jgi:putative addiction module component (TIGR02574 family)
MRGKLDMAPESQHLEKLPLAGRLAWVEDPWDSIAETQGEDSSVPQWPKAGLLRRKEEYARHPESARPWPEIKMSLLECE